MYKSPVTIKKFKLRLLDELNSPMHKLYSEAFLIDRLNKSTTFIFINLEACTHDCITYISEYEIDHFSSF